MRKGNVNVAGIILSSITFLVDSENITCEPWNLEHARQCQGKQIIGWEPNCFGFASCADTIIVNETDMDLDCDGGAACAGMRLGENSLFDYGYTEAFIGAANIEGEFSASSSLESPASMGFVNLIVHQTNLTSTSDGIEFRSEGYAGFANVNVMDGQIQQIEGEAYYSFYNTTGILSHGSLVDLNARLAGFNSVFYCPANHSCEINCNNNPTSCYNVTFICQTLQTCQVYGCNQTDGLCKDIVF